MTDTPPSPASLDGDAQPPPTAAQPVAAPTAGTADRPELPVVAAFAGGFLLANLLRRLAR